MLTDELCCVSLSVPEGEKDRTGMLENVCECVSVFNMSISRCARHVYQECSEKNGENFSLDVQCWMLFIVTHV